MDSRDDVYNLNSTCSTSMCCVLVSRSAVVEEMMDPTMKFLVTPAKWFHQARECRGCGALIWGLAAES